MFDWLKRKAGGTQKLPPSIEQQSGSDYIRSLLQARTADHLGKAAEAGRLAGEAVSAGNFDLAWKYYHEQKEHYLKHASESGFSPEHVLALNGSVDEDLANVLRLEGRHDAALVHIIYWVACSNRRAEKREQQKLKAYFNRCRFHEVTLDACATFTDQLRSSPDMRSIQSKISEWRSRSGNS